MTVKRDNASKTILRCSNAEMYEHIVIGAGINGSSAAYQLARRGRKVLVLEKVITLVFLDFN